MSGDMQPGHGGNAGLCLDEHTCPACEQGLGGMCLDLFQHPICGLVACDGEPGESRESRFEAPLTAAGAENAPEDVWQHERGSE